MSGFSAPSTLPVSSTILIGSAVTGFATTAAKNITSISLTAGDWNVWGNVGSNPGGGAVQSSFIGWIDSVSATLPDFAFTAFNALTNGANVGQNNVVPMRRFSLTSTTTIYLSGQFVFTGGTMSGYGTILARRAQ